MRTNQFFCIFMLCCDLFADLASSCTLPHNSIVHRFSGFAVPDKSGLSLIADSKYRYLFFVDSCFFDEIFYNLKGIRINLLRIMLDPSTFIDILFMWKISSAEKGSFFIKKESLCSLCTLIDPKYIFIHIISPVPLLFLRCLLHLIHNNQILLWMFL